MPSQKPKPKKSRSPSQASAFLLLPREIRDQIYAHVLCEQSCREIQVLCTCKQIAAEAQVFLFKRPLTFWSQTTLLEWLHRVGKAHLHHVTHIRIKIDNPVSHQSVERLCLREAELGSASPLAQLFAQESAKILTLLEDLPNVRDLTLLRGRRDSPHCVWQDTYLNFSSALGQRFLNLRSLAFHVHKVSLRSLAALKSLKTLRFTGFSTSTAQETLSILRGLDIEHLELVGIPHKSQSESDGPPIVRSLTPEVLRGLRPLRSFHICEIYTIVEEDQCMFFTEDMMQALYATHRKSLRDLGLSTCICPKRPATQCLKRLLSESDLRTIRLCSDPLDPALIHALPASSRRLQICVDPLVSPGVAEEVLATLRRKAQVEHLTHVDWRVREPFHRAGNVPQPPDDERVGILINASDTGFEVTSGKWHPLIFDDDDLERKPDLAQEWYTKH